MAVTTNTGAVVGVGLTVKLESTYHGDDYSSVCAVLWNPAEGKGERVGLCGGYGMEAWEDARKMATVDAPAEVKAAYEAWVSAEAEKKRLAEEAAEEERRAKLPLKGRTVKVVKGRKVAKGTVGKVIWYGAGKAYGYGPAPMRIGLMVEGTMEPVWLDAKNVEVLSA